MRFLSLFFNVYKAYLTKKYWNNFDIFGFMNHNGTILLHVKFEFKKCPLTQLNGKIAELSIQFFFSRIKFCFVTLIKLLFEIIRIIVIIANGVKVQMTIRVPHLQ